MGAVDGTVDGDFTFRAAAHCADLLPFGGAKPRSFTLFTNRAGHSISQRRTSDKAEYAALKRKSKAQEVIAMSESFEFRACSHCYFRESQTARALDPYTVSY